MAHIKRKWPWQARDIEEKEVGLRQANDVLQDSEEETSSRPAPPRWGEDAQSHLSPYGFSEDDAGLRQVESGAWRRAFPAKSAASRRQFVPNKGRPMDNNRPASSRANRFSSTLTWQVFCAAALVGAGYFVEHNAKVMTAIGGETQMVFDTDYTSQVQPAVDRAFADMHLAIPTFGATSRLHAPMAGTIVNDYGPNHPEIWIAGNPNETVMAAGSGTVLTVVKSGSTDVVKIDNGAFGTTIYAGLSQVSVQANEYVNAGESIGRLPTTPSHPSLRFSLVKNGQYENPHGVIEFSGTSP